MPVVTVSRQLGSLGDEIAADVAARLKLRLVDQDIINEVARRLGVSPATVTAHDEREPHLVTELVETMRRLYPATLAPSHTAAEPDIDQSAYLHVIRQVLEEIAREGNAVVVGRGSNFILGEHADVLHVLVTAPLEVRVERLMAAEHLDRQRASQRARGVDADRARYVRHYFQADWLDATRFDLALNTGHFTQIQAADLICAVLSSNSVGHKYC